MSFILQDTRSVDCSCTNRPVPSLSRFLILRNLLRLRNSPVWGDLRSPIPPSHTAFGLENGRQAASLRDCGAIMWRVLPPTSSSLVPRDSSVVGRYVRPSLVGHQNVVEQAPLLIWCPTRYGRMVAKPPPAFGRLPAEGYSEWRFGGPIYFRRTWKGGIFENGSKSR